MNSVPEVTVSLSTRDGNHEFRIQMSDEAFKQIEAMARARKKTPADVIIEALRLEQLFADGKLLVKSGGDVRELVAV